MKFSKLKYDNSEVMNKFDEVKEKLNCTDFELAAMIGVGKHTPRTARQGLSAISNKKYFLERLKEVESNIK